MNGQEQEREPQQEEEEEEAVIQTNHRLRERIHTLESRIEKLESKPAPKRVTLMSLCGNSCCCSLKFLYLLTG